MVEQHNLLQKPNHSPADLLPAQKEQKVGQDSSLPKLKMTD
jgi:hypothetical protein